ncbi:hypothetical protein [Mailhella massiliensis]|uniref:hypothetical protein n=1 Tax=Mailhella massiliensis TaxID=1903261 RepID=UPI0023F059B5|nr:hypothetical protein [Mailhella massiliensis]
MSNFLGIAYKTIKNHLQYSGIIDVFLIFPASPGDFAFPAAACGTNGPALFSAPRHALPPLPPSPDVLQRDAGKAGPKAHAARTAFPFFSGAARARREKEGISGKSLDRGGDLLPYGRHTGACFRASVRVFRQARHPAQGKRSSFAPGSAV